MIQVKFKNLEKSELAREAVLTRVTHLIEKFPALNESQIKVTLEMQNSRLQPGPDLFNVKFHIIKSRFDGITVTKANANLYLALADVIEHMLEKLNRFGDRDRVKKVHAERQIKKQNRHLNKREDFDPTDEIHPN